MMGTKVNSNYEDLLTFTRASKGHALRPVSYGDDLFDTDAFLTGIGSWSPYVNNTVTTISGENGVTITYVDGFNGAQLALSDAADLSSDLTVGAIYKLSLQAKYAGSGDGCKVSVFTTTNIGQTTVTSTDWVDVEITFIPTSSTANSIFTTDFETGESLSLRNISVKEVTFDQPDGTLTLFEHPNNVPRVEYDADGNRLGLLVEESRTNLIARSEDFSNAYWSKLGSSSIVSTDNLAPDGTLTASEISIGSGQSYIRRSEYSISVTDHSASFWVKAASSGSATAIRLTTNNTAAWGTGVSSKLTLTSEWQRIEVKGDLNSLAPSLNLLLGNADENNAVDTDCVGNVLVWGAQLEAGSFPTSYIKTTGSTATRSADVASIPVADFGFNADEGTLFAEVRAEDTASSTGHPFYYLKNDTSNYVRLDRYSAGFALRVRNGGAYQVQALIPGGEPNTTELHKVSAAYKANDFVYLYNGGTVGTDTSGTVPDGITTLHLSEGDFNGHIKKLMYIPRRLTNAQLVDLTS